MQWPFNANTSSVVPTFGQDSDLSRMIIEKLYTIKSDGKHSYRDEAMDILRVKKWLIIRYICVDYSVMLASQSAIDFW